MSAARFCLLVLLLASGGCSLAPARETRPLLAGSDQLVLVTTAGWDANEGTLRRYERASDGWRSTGDPVAVTIGRAGAAWGLGLHARQPGRQKREGDGRAPAGTFEIGTAFGYASEVRTGLAYQPMDEHDWCIDVVASPLYNRIVDAREVGTDAIAASTEPMRRDVHADGDARYELGFVVVHNAHGAHGAGSCIFAHVWKAPHETTAGCTAMDEAAMRALLAWLDRTRAPRFVLLPEAEHARLARAWGLPILR